MRRSRFLGDKRHYLTAPERDWSQQNLALETERNQQRAQWYDKSPSWTRILYSNYRQLGFFNQFGEFSSLAKFVSGSQEVASPIRLSCQVRAALFNK